MRCPACDAVMREVDRRGVRIDICPECKGVWLDRGELEKLIAVSREEADWDDVPPPPAKRSEGYHHGYPKRKKKRFFEEIFNVFD